MDKTLSYADLLDVSVEKLSYAAQGLSSLYQEVNGHNMLEDIINTHAYHIINLKDLNQNIFSFDTLDMGSKIDILRCLMDKALEIIKKKCAEVYPYLSNIIKEIFSLIGHSRDLIEKVKFENQELFFLNNELTITVEQLRVENKSYLEKIISNSKSSADISVSRLKSPSERKEIIPRQPSKIQFMKSRIANSRELTLKQLKEAIEDIYTNKTKFDEKCLENKQPRETMDQFLYTHLNQKYGLKTLIAEWSVSILKGIEKFETQDAEICLFSMILKNKVDEEFRKVFEKLKDNMKQLLKAKIQQRHPYIREPQLNGMLKEKLNGVLDEDEWCTIIVSMFSQEEAKYMIGNLKNLMSEKSNKTILFRRNKMLTQKSDATYAEIQNAILNYDLSAHEALLEPFWRQFVASDGDKNGILSEEEFMNLCTSIGIPDESERLLDQVDVNATGYINYSDCVNLFLYEMIQTEDSSTVSVIHSLFFQSQKTDN
jgi:Ca2+-binding EF-hand superfamily protein